VTKQAGLGMRLSVGGVDLSGDIGALSRIGGGLAGTQDVTAINQSAMDRAGLLRDGSIEWSAFLNTAAGGAHATFSALPTADQIMTVHTGTAIASAAASIVAKQVNYDPTRGADGALTIAGQDLGNGFGLEWGDQLTAWQRTDTAATNGAGVDFAATTAFGLAAVLHCYSVTGTSVTVKIQHSDDDAGTDPYADVTGAAFTAVAVAPAAQRIATATGLSVKRWLRVVTTGTFNPATFTVQAAKFETATVF
jgi:hypothetical protein